MSATKGDGRGEGRFNIQRSTFNIQRSWTWAMLFAGLGLALSARGEGEGSLALALSAEGRGAAAAVEFRRLALGAADAEEAGGWYWWAAYEYARGGEAERSNQMLDRAEDSAPFSLSAPTSWLRAENAARERDWTAAAFHFDSMRMKTADEGEKAFSARGAAAAHLREKNWAAAKAALAAAPGDLAGAREAIGRYERGRDKKPWAGGVLGLVPGLGYAYSGEWANAARSAILNGLFIWGMASAAEHEEWGVFALATFGEITWYTGSVYGGIDAAHRANRRRMEEAAEAVRGEGRPVPDRGQVPLVALRMEF